MAIPWYRKPWSMQICLVTYDIIMQVNIEDEDDPVSPAGSSPYENKSTIKKERPSTPGSSKNGSSVSYTCT